MSDNQTNEQHLPAAVQPVRDGGGRFAPGNPAAYGQPFQPGISGNPTGRPAGVTYPGDWIRGLSDCTEADLHKIADDDSEPISKRSAARMLLDTIDTSPEVRGRAAIRVMDRTEGKPGVKITLDEQTRYVDVAAIEARMVALLERNPALIEVAMQKYPAMRKVIEDKQLAQE